MSNQIQPPSETTSVTNTTGGAAVPASAGSPSRGDQLRREASRAGDFAAQEAALAPVQRQAGAGRPETQPPGTAPSPVVPPVAAADRVPGSDKAPPDPTVPDTVPPRPVTPAELAAGARAVVEQRTDWIEDTELGGAFRNQVVGQLGREPDDAALADVTEGHLRQARDQAEAARLARCEGGAGVAGAWKSARAENHKFYDVPPWLFQATYIQKQTFLGSTLGYHRDVASDLGRIGSTVTARARAAGMDDGAIAKAMPSLRPGNAFRFQTSMTGGRHTAGAAFDIQAGKNPMWYQNSVSDGTGVLVSAIAGTEVNDRKNVPSDKALAAQESSARAGETDMPVAAPTKGPGREVVSRTEAAFTRLTEAQAAVRKFWDEIDGHNKGPEELAKLLEPKVHVWLAQTERELDEKLQEIETLVVQLEGTADAGAKRALQAQIRALRDETRGQKELGEFTGLVEAIQAENARLLEMQQARQKLEEAVGRAQALEKEIRKCRAEQRALEKRKAQLERGGTARGKTGSDVAGGGDAALAIDTELEQKAARLMGLEAELDACVPAGDDGGGAPQPAKHDDGQVVKQLQTALAAERKDERRLRQGIDAKKSKAQGLLKKRSMGDVTVRLANIRGTLAKLQDPTGRNQLLARPENKRLKADAPGITQLAEHGMLSLPPWLVLAFADCGWRWGGTFSSPDPMHFETLRAVPGVRTTKGGSDH